MKRATILALVAGATGFVLPNLSLKQFSITKPQNRNFRHSSGGRSPWRGGHRESEAASTVEAFVDDVADGISHTIDNAIDALANAGQYIDEELGNRRQHGDRHHPSSDQNILETIKQRFPGSKFIDLIEQHDDIKQELQDNNNKKTVFVPYSEAVRIYLQLENPSPEQVRSVLRYHIAPDVYDVGRLQNRGTIATELELTSLGHHHQRLRIAPGLLGDINVNFDKRIIVPGIQASNGVVYLVNDVLVPPPRQSQVIDHLSDELRTFQEAMQTCGLEDELRRRSQRGGTIFAPTNTAWALLQDSVTKFLFSAEGKKYLRALLKYHIVANQTVYTDAFYERERDPRGSYGGDASERNPGNDRQRVSLRSLLGPKEISAEFDILQNTNYLYINDAVFVSTQNGIAHDGVVQLVPSVLIPPTKDRYDPNGDDMPWSETITVEELKKRLGDVDKEDGDYQQSWLDYDL